MNILISIYLILFLILSWRRLDWAVFFILATLPSYLIRFNIFGVPSTLLEGMILISFAVWFLKSYKEIFGRIKYKINKIFKSKVKGQRSKVIRYPFDIEIVLLLIISFVAVGMAGFTDASLGIWKAYFFEPVLFYVLLLNVLKSDPNDPNFIRMTRIKEIVWALGFSALGVSLVAIYQGLTGNLIFNEFWAAAESRRAVSVFGYPNAVGLYLAPIVMLMIGYFSYAIASLPAGKAGRSLSNEAATSGLLSRLLGIRNNKLFYFFFGLVITLSILAIYFAKSDGALIGLAVASVFFGILANKKLRWVTVLTVIIISAGIFFYAPVRIKIVDKITLMDLSGQIRKAQWKETWEMLKNNRIIFGSGLANYQKVVAPYHQEGIFVKDPHDPDWHRKTVFNAEFRNSVWQPVEIYMYPHNIFLNFWVELGLLGMILFIWVIIKFFYFGFKNLKLIGNWKPVRPVGGLEIRNLDDSQKYLVLGLISSMVVILIHGAVDVPYFKNDLAILFWVIIAMMGFLNLEVKNKNLE